MKLLFVAFLLGSAFMFSVSVGTKIAYSEEETAPEEVSEPESEAGSTSIELFGSDKTPPEISDVEVGSVTMDSATITWETNELGNSTVRYGVAPKTNKRLSDNDLVLSHSMTLSGLLSGIVYAFCVESHDKSQNREESCGYSFTTELESVSDTTAPVLLSVSVSDISTTGATISWMTNEIADGYVAYGTTNAYGSQTPKIETLDIEHTAVLSDLSEHTTYHVRAHSSDDFGNRGESSDVSFTTLSASDPEEPPVQGGPVISNVLSHDATTVSFWISWSTDVPADTQVAYGHDETYGQTSMLDSTLSNTHEVMLGNLSPNTAYHVRAQSADTSGTPSYSNDFVFQTLSETPPEEGEVSTSTPPTEEVSTSTPSNEPEPQSRSSRSSRNSGPDQVEDVAAYGLDHTIILSWNTDEEEVAGVQIVRSDAQYPEEPESGAIVYDGDGRIFSDINLTNNKTYYYSLFALDEDEDHSEPVQLSITPTDDPATYSSTYANTGRVNIITTDDFGIGTRGAVVEYLQTLLATDPVLYPEGLVTGYFGPLTQAALMRFQKENGIPETGRVDADVRAAAEGVTVSQQVPDIRSRRSDLELGSQGENVKVLQIALTQLGYLEEEAITGYFGQETKEAVASFQRDNNITPAYGYFGPITRRAILEKTSVSPNAL